jgi:hypothetical protein
MDGMNGGLSECVTRSGSGLTRAYVYVDNLRMAFRGSHITADKKHKKQSREGVLA